MELIHLQYFRTLAQLEHMTRASQALHIAQPALSRSLRNLETELGQPLFDRVGKGLRLNDNGRIFLKHCDVILDEMQRVKEHFFKLKAREDNKVYLCMLAGSKLLPDILRGFRIVNPHITIQIMQRPDTDEYHNAIIIDAVSELDDAQDCTVLMEEEIVLAMPRSNPLVNLPSVDLSQLADEAFIGLYTGTSLRTITDAYCKRAGFFPQIVMESDNPSTVRELISLGVGLAFIPRITWRGVEENGEIKMLPISTPKCSRYVIMKKRKNTNRASALFQAYLTDFFANISKGGVGSE